ncbi:alpha/beta hydrolase [Streptomyces sp. NPDC054849]
MQVGDLALRGPAWEAAVEAGVRPVFGVDVASLPDHEALGDRARLVAVEQGGHGLHLGNGNACGDRAVTVVLTTGRRPARDTECTDCTTEEAGIRAGTASRARAQPDGATMEGEPVPRRAVEMTP